MSKTPISKIINENINNGTDFEFYPTTNEILDAMYWDIKENKKDYRNRYEYQSIDILDIGAGNCKLYDRFREISNENKEYDSYNNLEREKMLGISKYMVIEKSQTLLNHMPSEVFVVGTDFHENFLVDKKTDIVFCNPPYSEYAHWTQRIIREANAEFIYLVIPKRWGKSQGIRKALKDRKARVKIVGDFSFEDAEDRKARAKVSLVKVLLKPKIKHNISGEFFEGSQIDPFEMWINETFNFTNAQPKKKDDSFYEKQKAREELKNQLVNATDLVGTLIELYNKEMEKLVTNYKKVADLDSEILEELNVDIKSLKQGLMTKIEGLKYKYWQEVFDNLGDIKKRLTKRSRNTLVNILNSQTNIDFTSSNIRAVVIWVIKNANKYYDNQMLEVYDDFTTEEGITLYKSNQRFNKDDFRYLKRDKKLEKYSLDYRLVKHGFLDDYDKKYRSNLSQAQIDAIEDIVTIGKNLGFKINTFDFSSIQRGNKINLCFTREGENKLLKIGTKTAQGKIEEVYFHTNTPNEDGERVMEKDGVFYVYSEDSNNEYHYLINGVYYHPDAVYTQDEVFTTIKGFQNGNVHYQFNKKFIKKLNLEVGRLRGWIKSPSEAAEEFDITMEEAAEYWKSTYQVLPSTLSHLLPQPKKEPVFNIETIENNEVGLFQDDKLIYKSEKGAILALSEISLEDISEETSKQFMEKVYINSITEEENVIVVDNVIEVKVEDTELSKNIYEKEQLEAFNSGSLF